MIDEEPLQVSGVALPENFRLWRLSDDGFRVVDVTTVSRVWGMRAHDIGSTRVFTDGVFKVGYMQVQTLFGMRRLTVEALVQQATYVAVQVTQLNRKGRYRSLTNVWCRPDIDVSIIRNLVDGKIADRTEEIWRFPLMGS